MDSKKIVPATKFHQEINGQFESRQLKSGYFYPTFTLTQRAKGTGYEFVNLINWIKIDPLKGNVTFK